MKIYKINKKDLLKNYIKMSIQSLLRKNYSKENNDSYLEMNFATEILFPNIYNLCCSMKGGKRYLKANLEYEQYFWDFILTDFEKRQINEALSVCLNDIFLYYMDYKEHDNSKFIDDSRDFLKAIDLDYAKELDDSINNKTLEVGRKDKYFKGMSGIFKNKNYYIISKHDGDSYSLNHEIMHGIIFNKLKHKFCYTTSSLLYREIASILIELYTNDYFYDNNKISKDEYLSHLTDIYSANIDGDIENLYVLIKLAENDFDKNIKNVIDFIDELSKDDIRYRSEIDELNYSSLKFYSIYFYSCAIAIAIYYNNINNPKKGMKDAINLMSEISIVNEEEVFKKYNIDLVGSLKRFIKENNEQVKIIKKKSLI